MYSEGKWVEYQQFNGKVKRGYIHYSDGEKAVVVSINPPFAKTTISVDSLTYLKSSLVVGDLNEMLDLALSTHDRQWFIEISQQLNKLKQHNSIS